MKSNLLMFESKIPIFIIIFYQRMSVSPEARRLSKYNEKKKEFSVATLQFDVTFCTPIPCAPSTLIRLIREEQSDLVLHCLLSLYASFCLRIRGLHAVVDV